MQHADNGMDMMDYSLWGMGPFWWIAFLVFFVGAVVMANRFRKRM
ncbi:MAG: hypothetical protein RIG68_25830 [Imperialibacter sp.]